MPGTCRCAYLSRIFFLFFVLHPPPWEVICVPYVVVFPKNEIPDSSPDNKTKISAICDLWSATSGGVGVYYCCTCILCHTNVSTPPRKYLAGFRACFFNVAYFALLQAGASQGRGLGEDRAGLPRRLLLGGRWAHDQGVCCVVCIYYSACVRREKGEVFGC